MDIWVSDLSEMSTCQLVLGKTLTILFVLKFIYTQIYLGSYKKNYLYSYKKLLIFLLKKFT